MLLSTLLFSLLVGVPELKRPHVTIPQGYIESGMNRKAKGKCGEQGAWQVKESDWGKVPKDIKGQAEQAERILDELLESSNNNLHTALRKYNGSGKQALLYADKVRKRSIESALIRV